MQVTSHHLKCKNAQSRMHEIVQGCKICSACCSSTRAGSTADEHVAQLERVCVDVESTMLLLFVMTTAGAVNTAAKEYSLQLCSDCSASDPTETHERMSDCQLLCTCSVSAYCLPGVTSCGFSSFPFHCRKRMHTSILNGCDVVSKPRIPLPCCVSHQGLERWLRLVCIHYSGCFKRYMKEKILVFDLLRTMATTSFVTLGKGCPQLPGSRCCGDYYEHSCNCCALVHRSGTTLYLKV